MRGILQPGKSSVEAASKRVVFEESKAKATSFADNPESILADNELSIGGKVAKLLDWHVSAGPFEESVASESPNQLVEDELREDSDRLKANSDRLKTIIRTCTMGRFADSSPNHRRAAIRWKSAVCRVNALARHVRSSRTQTKAREFRGLAETFRNIARLSTRVSAYFNLEQVESDADGEA